MEEICRAKLEQHVFIQKRLRQTGGREIIEDSPADSFWGWGRDRKGLNKLGKITPDRNLMRWALYMICAKGLAVGPGKIVKECTGQGNFENDCTVMVHWNILLLKTYYLARSFYFLSSLPSFFSQPLWPLRQRCLFSRLSTPKLPR